MAKAFDGQVVMVTGASAGIGAEMCRQFAAAGAHVVATARREDRLRDLCTEIEAMGVRALPVACDVTRDGDCEAAVARALEEFGHLDIVVANAGFGVVGRLDVLELDDWRRQYETNVFGLLRTIYASLPALRESRGRLVLISSVVGFIPMPGSLPYSSSKFAVTAIGFALRHELAADGVSVTLISPGFVDSEISQVDNRGNFRSEAKDKRPASLRMRTDVCVRHILKAVRRRKAHAVITGHGKFGVWLQRHFPWLVSKVISGGSFTRREPKTSTASQ